MSDRELTQYLSDVFVNSLSAYMMIVDEYFPDLKPILNLAAQMPCQFGFATNRVSLRYAFIPVDSEKEMTLSHVILDKTIDIADPKWKINVYDAAKKEEGEILEGFVISKLRHLKKYRPPLSPIHRVESIEKFFGDKPINYLVDTWLMFDFRSVFGFSF